MNLEEYAQTAIDLHHKLNDVKLYSRMSNEYQTFWRDSSDITTVTRAIMSFSGGVLIVHDQYVENLSERRSYPNGYTADFTVNALVHNDRNEVGYQRVRFAILTNESVRDLNGKELFDFQCNAAGTHAVFIYHKGHNLTKLVITGSIKVQIGA